MSESIHNAIRVIPDFPNPGIQFKDITPALSNPAVFQEIVDLFAARYRDRGITQIACIESRGFLFGAPLAIALGAGVTLIRKKGKLPAETVQESYELEYGTDTLEIHADALSPEDRVLVIDDLLATGGTAEAAGKLLTKVGATIDSFAFLIELGFLEGRARLEAHKHEVFSILSY